MVTLIVKLGLDQTNENYQAVVDALAPFNILSASWEEPKSTGRSGDDLGNNLSQAIDKLRTQD